MTTPDQRARTRLSLSAKIALGLLSRRSTPDNQPIVEASLNAQDGWLYFGPVRLLRMPRLNWE